MNQPSLPAQSCSIATRVEIGAQPRDVARHGTRIRIDDTRRRKGGNLNEFAQFRQDYLGDAHERRFVRPAVVRSQERSANLLLPILERLCGSGGAGHSFVRSREGLLQVRGIRPQPFNFRLHCGLFALCGKQFGLNAKSLTVSVPVSLVAFSDVQSMPPPPPQAGPVSASATIVASKAFVMWLPHSLPVCRLDRAWLGGARSSIRRLSKTNDGEVQDDAAEADGNRTRLRALAAHRFSSSGAVVSPGVIWCLLVPSSPGQRASSCYLVPSCDL